MRGRGRGWGSAENMQRGSADEMRSMEGKRGADGRAAREREGRGGTTDGDGGEGEEYCIRHAPSSLQCVPHPHPQPPPTTLLYLDKNCEVVRFHSASRAHSDGFQPPDVSAPQDDPMFAHTLPKNSGRVQICSCLSALAKTLAKHLLEQTLRLSAWRLLFILFFFTPPLHPR